MAWVRFTKDFRFKPTPNVTTKYVKGWEGLVTHACADQAIAAGAAKAVKAPPRKGKSEDLEG